MAICSEDRSFLTPQSMRAEPNRTFVSGAQDTDLRQPWGRSWEQFEAEVKAKQSASEVLEVSDDSDDIQEIQPTEAEMEERRLQRELNKLLGLRNNQVPEYILRMRQRGCMGYPPALTDE